MSRVGASWASVSAPDSFPAASFTISPAIPFSRTAIVAGKSGEIVASASRGCWGWRGCPVAAVFPEAPSFSLLPAGFPVSVLACWEGAVSCVSVCRFTVCPVSGVPVPFVRADSRVGSCDGRDAWGLEAGEGESPCARGVSRVVSGGGAVRVGAGRVSVSGEIGVRASKLPCTCPRKRSEKLRLNMPLAAAFRLLSGFAAALEAERFSAPLETGVAMILLSFACVSCC